MRSPEVPRCRSGGFGLAFGLAETTASGILGAYARDLLGAAARVFLGLAALGLGTLAGKPIGFEGMAGGSFLGVAALLGLMHPGIGEGTGARVDFVTGELTQNDAGAGGGLRVFADLGACTGNGGLGHRRSGRRTGRFRLLLAGKRHPAFLALDLNGVGAAVREALANGVALHPAAALQRQARLGGDADRLVSSGLAIVHTFLRSCGRCTQLTRGIGFAVAARVGHVGAVTDEVADPRQHVAARRPGE